MPWATSTAAEVENGNSTERDCHKQSRRLSGRTGDTKDSPAINRTVATLGTAVQRQAAAAFCLLKRRCQLNNCAQHEFPAGALCNCWSASPLSPFILLHAVAAVAVPRSWEARFRH